MYRKITILLLASLFLAVPRVAAQDDGGSLSPEVVEVSDIYATTFQFATDLIYTNSSDPENIFSAVAKDCNNILAVMASRPFEGTSSIFALESNGILHSYILRYRRNPRTLIIDEKNGLRTAVTDTIDLSLRYHTHLVFSRSIAYADVSQLDTVMAMKVDQSPNMLRAKARMPFSGTSTLTVKETDGDLRAFYLRFNDNPSRILYDMRDTSGVNRRGEAGVTETRDRQAPLLETVLDYPQMIFHISEKRSRIRFSCENIFTYSDILYIVLRLENRSSVSFEYNGASFKLAKGVTLFPKSQYGSLVTAAGKTGRMVFSFPKFTVQDDDRLKIDIYEKNGNRSQELILTAEDVNNAPMPKELLRK